MAHLQVTTSFNLAVYSSQIWRKKVKKYKLRRRVERRPSARRTSLAMLKSPAIPRLSHSTVLEEPRRNYDLGEKKHHVPMVDHTPIESPHVVIAAICPPGVS